MVPASVGIFLLCVASATPENGTARQELFYLPENPAYTIMDSAMDSVRFTVDKTLTVCDQGHVASKSSFVDPEGAIMDWHDFGTLEGPGWAANAAGGAYEIHRMGAFLDNPEWTKKALGILDHVLDHGFIDHDTGFIQGYRDTVTGEILLNYRSDSDWFCPGSMAKIAYQLLLFADELGEDPRASRMRDVAVRCAAWIDEHVSPTENGWFPRRCEPSGKTFRDKPRPAGRADPFWQTSADGLFIIQLQAELHRRGLADYSEQMTRMIEVFMKHGGIFGSINHDTYDAQENVAYSVAFRTLLLASRVLGDSKVRDFAYGPCLAGLDRFKMNEDRNGVLTKGLLYMEDSWDTAYLWENAEAALAYFEAALDTRKDSPEKSRDYELQGLTILRSIARHHYGPHGFLTEGVDWNNHVSAKHHIDQAEYGAIQYTEPFLNNQHIVEPTLFYLEHLAKRREEAGRVEWRDCEGNVLYREGPGPNAAREVKTSR